MKTKHVLSLLAVIFAAFFSVNVALADTSKTVNPGAHVVFSIQNLTGTAPFTYQWQKDGANISGATAATLDIPAVSAANTGTYVCVITNQAGSGTTDKGVFTVAVLPSGQILITQVSP